MSCEDFGHPEYSRLNVMMKKLVDMFNANAEVRFAGECMRGSRISAAN